MKTENHPNAEISQSTPKNPGTGESIKELGRDIGKDLLRETATTLKWALGGAVVGAVVLGGLGLWKFGLTGLGIGAVAGAVVGGAIGFWAYFSA
jgi:uncharacterized protein YcfJ